MAVQNYSNTNLLDQIKRLSISERILIVEDIWDSMALSKEELPITEKQKKELGKRLKDYKKNPNDGASWEEVKNRITSNL